MPETAPGFDLVVEPWIPVLDQTGQVRERSIVEVLAEAPTIVELRGEVPTQEFTLLRLLLAILHRALHDRETGISGPCSVGEWAELRDDWPSVVAVVSEYLQEHRERFDLFHPRTPFFQVADLHTAKDEAAGLHKLIIDVPSGAPFLTTRLGRGLERISAAEAARWLVHVHAFDPSGIRSGAVGDTRVKGGKGYPIGPGWAGQLGGVHLLGSSLLDTLLLNLVVPDEVMVEARPHDLPPWERPPHGPQAEERPPHVNVPTGPVDLYTWQARRVRLIGDRSGVTGLVLANGDRMEPQNRQAVEPMTVWRYSEPQTKKFHQDTYMPRLHDPHRVLWRGLASLLPMAAGPPGDRSGPPRWLAPTVVRWAGAQRVASILRRDGIGPVRLRAVGLVYGSNNSVVDEMVDDRLVLPLALLEDHDGRLTDLATHEVQVTETAVNALRDLAARLALAAGGDPKSLDGPRDRAAELAYAELDLPFRNWLASLTAEESSEDAARRWRRVARPIVRDAATTLVDGCGPAAWAGRIIAIQGKKKVLMDAGLAARWFETALSKTLPYDSPTLEAGQP
jgi:CRISPR system Cascade subunit CasA